MGTAARRGYRIGKVVRWYQLHPAGKRLWGTVKNQEKGEPLKKRQDFSMRAMFLKKSQKKRGAGKRVAGIQVPNLRSGTKKRKPNNTSDLLHRNNKSKEGTKAREGSYTFPNEKCSRKGKGGENSESGRTRTSMGYPTKMIGQRPVWGGWATRQGVSVSILNAGKKGLALGLKKKKKREGGRKKPGGSSRKLRALEGDKCGDERKNKPKLFLQWVRSGREEGAPGREKEKSQKGGSCGLIP